MDFIVSSIAESSHGFFSNTSQHEKKYVGLVGALASIALVIRGGKTASLVGRCASLFASGQILLKSFEESWEKIAVAVIKTAGISLGIAAISFSSPSLLAASFICDMISLCGRLYGISQMELDVNVDFDLGCIMARNFFDLISNVWFFSAIVTSSPEVLVVGLLFNYAFVLIMGGLSMVSFNLHPDGDRVSLCVVNLLSAFCLVAQIDEYSNIDSSTILSAISLAVPSSFSLGTFTEFLALR